MASKKDYSIDDILNELDKKRHSDDDSKPHKSSSASDFSATDIIQNPHKQSKFENTEQTAENSKPSRDFSVTDIINSDKLKEIEKDLSQKDNSASSAESKTTPVQKTESYKKANKNKAKKAVNHDNIDKSEQSFKNKSSEITDEQFSSQLQEEVVKQWMPDENSRKKQTIELEEPVNPALPPKEPQQSPFMSTNEFSVTSIIGLSKNREEDSVKVYEPAGYNPIAQKGDIPDDSSDKINKKSNDKKKKYTLSETAQMRKIKKAEAIKQALLELDSNLSTPEDLINEINPLEQLEETRIATEEDFKQKKPKNISDTDLQSAEVKQYNIKSTRKPEIHEVLQKIKTTANKDLDGEKIRESRSNTALIESLNKKLEEKRKSDVNAQRTITISLDSDNTGKANNLPKRLNIDYSKQIMSDTDSFHTEDLNSIENKIEDLRKKRKHKIRDFVLTDIDEDAAVQEEYDDDDTEDENEYKNYEDTSVIQDYLRKVQRGLSRRFLILFVLSLFTVVLTVMNDLKIEVPIHYFDKRFDVTAYLYTNLIIGIFACSSAYTVLTRGLTNLFTLKADGDSICALSISASLAGIVVQLTNTDYVQRSLAHVYISVAVVSLLFNTVGKIYIVSRTRRNFRFVSGDSQKFAGFIIDEKNTADAFTSGMKQHAPILGSMRKTEFLSDFLKSSYSYDIADHMIKFLAPISLIAAIGLGAFAYTAVPDGNKVSWAFTVFNAVLCLCTPFGLMLIVNRPLSIASKTIEKSSVSILGYDAVDNFSDVNSIMIDAVKLFPEGSVGLRKIVDNIDKIKSNVVISIDEALITAASLAISTGSIMSTLFLNMVDGKREILYKVSNPVYEDSMGISGWINNRRVMLGNRDQMKNHNIKVPNVSKEHKYIKEGTEGVYLAISGEIVALFLIEMRPNQEVKKYLKELERSNVSIILKTTDSIVSVSKLADMFEINPDMLKILPFRLHENYNEQTKYTSNSSGSFSCNGTFSSFARGILAIKKLQSNAIFNVFFQSAMIILGVLLLAIFTMFSLQNNISPMWILFYNAVSSFLILIAQSIWKY